MVKHAPRATLRASLTMRTKLLLPHDVHYNDDERWHAKKPNIMCAHARLSATRRVRIKLTMDGREAHECLLETALTVGESSRFEMRFFDVEGSADLWRKRRSQTILCTPYTLMLLSRIGQKRCSVRATFANGEAQRTFYERRRSLYRATPGRSDDARDLNAFKSNCPERQEATCGGWLDEYTHSGR